EKAVSDTFCLYCLYYRGLPGAQKSGGICERTCKASLDSAWNDLSAYKSGSLGTVDSVMDRIETDSTISKTRDGVLETHDKATGILNSISGLIEEVTNSKEQ